MTLLEHRIKVREEALLDLFTWVDKLRQAHTGGYSDVSHLSYLVEMAASRVADLSLRIEDLEDIQSYGPDGGR